MRALPIAFRTSSAVLKSGLIFACEISVIVVGAGWPDGLLSTARTDNKECYFGCLPCAGGSALIWQSKPKILRRKSPKGLSLVGLGVEMFCHKKGGFVNELGRGRITRALDLGWCVTSQFEADHSGGLRSAIRICGVWTNQDAKFHW